MKKTAQLLSEICKGSNEEEILEQILEPLWERGRFMYKLDKHKIKNSFVIITMFMSYIVYGRG